MSPAKPDLSDAIPGRMKRRLSALLAIALVAIALVGCSPSASPTDGGESAPASAPSVAPSESPAS